MKKTQSFSDRLCKRSKLGFSLVELIVVVAIMAVLVAVLAPSLLSYVERSRAQKDESAMGEVTNAVLLAMSDMDVYDELLEYSIKDNVSCYIDKTTETEVSSGLKIKTKDATSSTVEQYTFGDDARIADETPYYAAGNMRGVTITFEPLTNSKVSEYVLSDGIINKFASTDNTDKLELCVTLYNRVRATVGDKIEQTSQTYRNSEYTIFIRIGTTGGNQSSNQDAVQVYGQYSGTNLPVSVSDEYLVAGGRTTTLGTSEDKPVVPNDQLLSIEKLQEIYSFSYYSTINQAIDDVNSQNIGENANSNKENAIAGVCVINGVPNVVLLQDTTTETRISPSGDMVINLGGYSLKSQDVVIVDIIKGNVTIDGRIGGSLIEKTSNNNPSGPILIQAVSGNVVINGGTYKSTYTLDDTVEPLGLGNVAILSAANLKIVNAVIDVYSMNAHTSGVQFLEGSLEMLNCNITSASHGKTVYGVINYATANIIDCTINAFNDYEEDYSDIAIGIKNYKTLTLNNCHVMSVHSGVQNSGTLNVNGGTYEGYGHGGFYFVGTSTESNVKNATIKECAMPNGYVDKGGACNEAAFYIGGSTGNDNNIVYMDNCDLYATRQTVVLRGSSNEKNNSLYISNSTLHSGYIRIDKGGHKLYIGKGCNFGIDKVKLKSGLVLEDTVFIEDKEYK